MGIDYTVYVGPFLKCKNAKVDGERTITACTKKSCKKHKDEIWDDKKKFCEECGSPIDKVQIKVKEDRVDTDPCQEGIDEDLIPYHLDAKNAKGFDIWIGNMGRKDKDARKFSFSPKYDGEQCEEITPEMMAEEIKDFQEQYKTAIKTITDLYGKENVQLKWGVIHEIN